MERPVQNISYFDLKTLGYEVTFIPARIGSYKVESCMLNGKTLPIKKLKEALFSLGLDLKRYPLEVVVRHHRPLTQKTNEAVAGFLFSAPERLDSEWIYSGYASDEAKTYTSKFSDIGSYLSKMRRGGDRD